MTITLLAKDIQYDFDGPEETGYPDELVVEVDLHDQILVGKPSTRSLCSIFRLASERLRGTSRNCSGANCAAACAGTNLKISRSSRDMRNVKRFIFVDSALSCKR